ncbi:MAG: type II toxin-antitoxin system CcdA family antitoxin [Methylobacter sp.]|nr:type II toxin-antitoxin system CcdA family antitoxin [Methylobacter sp.]
MRQIYDTSAPKKTTNLSINSALLHEAKALKINLSATLEAALLNELKAAHRDLKTRNTFYLPIKWQAYPRTS